MKKIVMVLGIIGLFMNGLFAFEIEPSDIEMIDGQTLVNFEEADIYYSYAKSKEQVDIEIADYYLAIEDKAYYEGVLKVVIDPFDCAFEFFGFLPEDEQGNSYIPRRRMVFYNKRYEDINFKMNTPSEDVYVDDLGMIYVEANNLGNYILYPISSKDYPFLEEE